MPLSIAGHVSGRKLEINPARAGYSLDDYVDLGEEVRDDVR